IKAHNSPALIVMPQHKDKQQIEQRMDQEKESDDDQEQQPKSRVERMKDMPDGYAGVVFWQDVCKGKGWNWMEPTMEKLQEYVRDYVPTIAKTISQEEVLVGQREPLQEASSSPVPVNTRELFIRPIARLLGWVQDQGKIKRRQDVREEIDGDKHDEENKEDSTQALTRHAITKNVTTTTTTLSFKSAALLSSSSPRSSSSSSRSRFPSLPPMSPSTSTPSSPVMPSQEPELTPLTVVKMSTPLTTTSATTRLTRAKRKQTQDAENDAGGTGYGLQREGPSRSSSGMNSSSVHDNKKSRPSRHRDDVGVQSTISSGPSSSSFPEFKAQEFQVMKTSGLTKQDRDQRQRLVPDDTSSIVYFLNQDVVTVPDALQEWRFGIHGGPAIQDLNSRFMNKWRAAKDTSSYIVRTTIIKEYIRLVTEEDYDDEEAIRALEILRGSSSLGTLNNYIRQPNHTKKRMLAYARGRRRGEGDTDTNVEDLGSEQKIPRRFPFPVRDLDTFHDIWKEWTVGWEEGGESIENLVWMHGKLWNHERFKDKHYQMFRVKNQIVREVRKVVKSGVVGSAEEALDRLESARAEMMSRPSSFLKSQAWKEIQESWKAGGP
ncbi:hypothetical protein BGZ83_011646, partial [Gryganskiella cystojenkinii]